MKVPLDRQGAGSFKYTVSAKAAEFENSKGPFKVALPSADELRFVAIGNTYCSGYSDAKAPKLAAAMLKCHPQLFVHLGKVMELQTWDYSWDPHFFDKWGPLTLTVPTLLAPDYGDHCGMGLKTFYTPAGQGPVLNWTQTIGQVLLIGIDGLEDWSAKSKNAKWLQGILKGSQAKFIFAFDHFPGYSTGREARPVKGKLLWQPLQQCRDTILPMLGRYKATAILSADDFHYERREPTPDKGVTCFVVGGGGAKTYRNSGRASAVNPFAQTGFYRDHVTGFVCFVIQGDTCKMQAITYEGEVVDQKTFALRRL